MLSISHLLNHSVTNEELSARAGTQGRCFAVVASEISSLAIQSTETGFDIVKIVNQVISSVETLTNCLVDTLDFLENKVMNDYKDFEQSSNDYNEVTQSIKEFMDQANEEVTLLATSIEHINDSMTGVNNNIGECSTGITDIAMKTSNVVELTIETFNKTANCKNLAEK